MIWLKGLLFAGSLIGAAGTMPGRGDAAKATGSLPTQLGKATVGYGSCTRCSCPGFIGGGYTCTRGGCHHHFDSHR